MSHRWPIALVAILFLATVGLAVWLVRTEPDDLDDLWVDLGLRDAETEEIGGSGTIEATRIDLSAEAEGRVAAVLVTAGNEVLAGDVLVVLDTTGIDAQIRAAEEALAATEAQLRLVTPGATGPRVRLAEAGVALAQARLNTLLVQRTRTRLLAPTDGTVARVHAREGDNATAGTPLVHLVRPSPVTLTVFVPEDELDRVRLDQPADVEVDAFPDDTFTGRVSAIATQAEFTPRNVQTEDDRAILVYAVKIELPNEAGDLKPGMPADAVIEVR